MKIDDPTKAGIGLAIVTVIIGLLVLFFAYFYVENKTAQAYERSEVWVLQLGEGDRWGGCAVSSTCDESLTRLYLRDRPEYYSKYEQGSDEYWWAYCSLLPDKCK